MAASMIAKLFSMPGLRYSMRVSGPLFVAVADAEAATQVDVVELDAFASELVHETEDLVGRFGHRRRVEELGADVAVDAADLDVRQPGGLAVEIQRFGEGDAELVAAQAGGNVRVGVGINVRVDAEGDRRTLAHAGGHLREAADAGRQRVTHFVGALADAGEDHLAGIATGRQHAGELAARDDVETGPESGEDRQDAEIGVGLDRVADQRLAQAEGALIRLVGGGEGGAGVNVGRGAEAVGNVGEGDPFEGQAGRAGGERRHGQGGRHWAGS